MARGFETQVAQLKQKLDMHGSVTARDAEALDIGNIYDVIMRLRQQGVKLIPVTNVDAEGNQYTRYIKGH